MRIADSPDQMGTQSARQQAVWRVGSQHRLLRNRFGAWIIAQPMCGVRNALINAALRAAIEGYRWRTGLNESADAKLLGCLEQGFGRLNIGRFIIAARAPDTGEGGCMDDGVDPVRGAHAKLRVEDGTLHALHTECSQGRVGLSGDTANTKAFREELATDFSAQETTVAGNQDGGTQLPTQYRTNPGNRNRREGGRTGVVSQRSNHFPSLFEP